MAEIQSYEDLKRREQENRAAAMSAFGGPSLGGDKSEPELAGHDIKNLDPQADLAKRLYVYNGEPETPEMSMGRFTKPGDIMYREDDVKGPDGRMYASFVSSRGVGFGYSVAGLEDKLAEWGMTPMFPDGAAEPDLRAAMDTAYRQSMYMDADLYRRPPDGGTAAGFYNLDGSDDDAGKWCRIQQGASGFTVASCGNGRYAAGWPSEYAEFNPTGERIFVLNDFDRIELDRLRSEDARPANKMLRMLGLKDREADSFAPYSSKTAFDYMSQAMDGAAPVGEKRDLPSPGVDPAPVSEPELSAPGAFDGPEF